MPAACSEDEPPLPCPHAGLELCCPTVDEDWPGWDGYGDGSACRQRHPGNNVCALYANPGKPRCSTVPPPTAAPSAFPTAAPSDPTSGPSSSPTTLSPSVSPSASPSESPRASPSTPAEPTQLDPLDAPADDGTPVVVPGFTFPSQPFTVQAWVKTTDPAKTQFVFRTGSDALLKTNSETLWLYHRAGGWPGWWVGRYPDFDVYLQSSGGGSDIAQDQWHFMTLVVPAAGGNVRLFQDCAEVPLSPYHGDRSMDSALPAGQRLCVGGVCGDIDTGSGTWHEYKDGRAARRL